MADFKLTAKVTITEANIQAKALSKLKNLKINLDTKSINEAVSKSKKLSKTLLATQKDADKLNKKIMGMKRSARSVKRTEGAVKKLGKSMKQAVRGGKDMADMFEEIGRRALAFRVAATFINTFTDSVSDAARFLLEFDQILADIAKISGQTFSELEVVGSRLLSTAADLGTVAEETASQFRIFVQAGFDVETALEFATKSMQGFNATTLEANQASEIFIQTMKVFGASEADKIFDKLAVAESSAAVTAKDLQEGMKRSAATFKAVGASLDDMIGLLSAFQEASRRGGAVGGTAFRTILTRLTAGDTAEAVKKLGVEVAETNGDMRNIVTVISELAVRFESLTEEQRVQAATTIAGRRQFESFLIMLDTIGRAQGIAAKTTDSAGEAIKRSAIQAETLNGKLKTLRNTFLKMVTGMEEFIPIRDIFSNILTLTTKLIGSFGGMLGKLAAMSALVIGLKSLGPVLKGLGRLAAGVGSAFPAMMAGGLGFAPGGFGIGKGKTKNERITGKFGQKFNRSTTSSPLGGAQQKIAGGPGLNIAALALGVTLAGVSSAMEDTDDATQKWKKEIVKTGSTMATAFMFGPVIGGLTSLFLGIKNVKGAIDDNVDRNHAYRMSLIKFSGNEGLAGMEAALVDAKSAGDAHTVALLQNAIAFEQAASKLKSDPGQMVDVVHNIQNVLDVLEDFAPGQEVGESFKSDIASAFEKAGLKPQEIIQLMGDPETFREILEKVGFTIKGSGSVWDEFQRQVNEDLVNMKKLATIIDLDNVFDADFIRGQQQFRNAIQESELANQIFIKGITDVNEIRKLESAQAIKSADSVVAKEKEIFREMLGDFAKLSGLDFKETLGAFEGVFGDDVRNAPDAKKGIEQLADIFDTQRSSVEDVEKELTKLVEVYMRVQKGSVDYRQELLKEAQVKREADFATIIKAQSKLREEREREASVMDSLADSFFSLGAVDFDNFNKVFDDLSTSLSDKATTDELFNLLGIIEDLKNPIAQARAELEGQHFANLNNIASIQATIDLIDELTAAYTAAEPSEERNIKLKELEKQKLDAVAEQDKARGKTLDDAQKSLKKVRVTEQKAMDDLVKAEIKLFETQKDLENSLIDLKDSFKELSNQQHADAQEKLKESQMAVMESTEGLADAYNDLMEAQLELGDVISDYRVGIGLAAMQVDIITGNIRGFGSQMNALQDVFDEAIGGVQFFGTQMVNTTRMTEEQRLNLLQESAQKQLDLVQKVIDETLSIGQKFFTTDAGDQAGLARGFSALQNVAGQFQAGGGFGGVDLNEFGNMLLNLPQSLREEMINALGSLPSTATLGGLTKDELEKILFGAAVGESEAVGIEHIAELTDIQVDLIRQIAELDQAGILTAEAGLEEARKQTELAENQLLMDEFALQQAEQNVAEVRSEIQQASNLLGDIQRDGLQLVSDNISSASFENLSKRQAEHLARLASLQSIDLNIGNLASTMNKVGEALSGAVAAEGVFGAYGGHIPKNFAKGNMYAGLIKAYSREKRMGPPGSNPVIANDTEMIIPTKSRGHMPNYQGGNASDKIFDTSDIERLLEGILEAVVQSIDGTTTAPTTQRVEANINVNAEQRVRIEGASSVADAVAKSVRSALNDQVSHDQLASIEDTILEFFNVLKSKGLVNTFGQG